MSLGYALLHRNRIQVALEAESQKKSFDDLADFAFGVMGAGDLGAAVNDFVRSRSQALNTFIDQARSRFTGENGPFSFLRHLFDLDISAGSEVAQLGRDLAESVGRLNGPLLRERLTNWAERLCSVLPELNGQGLNQFLKQQVNDITAILEKPLRSGRRDVAAHRAFRAAVTLRQLIGEGLEAAPWADAGFDAKATLCGMLRQIITGLDDTAVAGALEFVQRFQGEFGKLVGTSFSFSAGVSVSGGAGASGMPDDVPDFRDEDRAVSHPDPGGLWGIDLTTNIFATLFLIWESVRTGNYHGRGFDGFLSVITIVWQAVHTVVRAAWPEEINREREEPDAGKIFVNWLFTDQGNMSLNILIRLFQSLHERRTASNWALSFAQRSLKYFSNVTNVRLIYYFARSVWYLKDRAANRIGDEPATLSLVRILWAVWAPMSWISTFFSFFLSWDDFTLEKGFTARTIVLLILSLVVGAVMGYVTLGQLADESPFGMSIRTDGWTIGLFFGLWILGVIALIIILADLESESRGLAIGFFVAFAVLMLGSMVGLPFFAGDDKKGEHFFLQAFIITTGLFVAGVLPFFMWWFYVDDGRDKHDLFAGKNPDTSPYKLPYPAGENWLCGQGGHGIFSHIPTDVTTTRSLDNHYAYDFNEDENKNALAARGGIVLDVIKDNENGSDDANFIDVQHLSWQDGHDPGTDQERVLTYATYYHLSQNRVWTDVGHRFVQGCHLADIDSTGRSAQHHLHFHVEEHQRRVQVPTTTGPPQADGRNMVIPVVFRDDSTRRFRNFPLLAWIPGKGRIPGKPLSMAFYTSENQKGDPLVNPMVLSLAENGTPSHEHWLILDKRIIANGPLPNSLTIRTTVAERHFHEITLNQGQLADVLRLQLPSGLTVSSVNGHDHDVIGHKNLQPVIDILLTSAGKPEHVHWLTLNQRRRGWEWGPIPATVNITTDSYTDPASGLSHNHPITLTHAQLVDILRRRRLPRGLNVTAAGGHRHRLQAMRQFPEGPSMQIVEPPRGRLLAAKPGPYRLFGDQFVARVNERAIEYFFYGAQRPLLRGEIALDRGLHNSHPLDIGGRSYRVAAAVSDLTVRGSMEALNSEFRGAISGIHLEMRAEPVIVVETILRGSDAALRVGAGSSAALVTAGEANGSGDLGDLTQVTPAQLAGHFDQVLKHGWPAPPAAVHAQVDGGNHLELQLGASAIAFPDQKTRSSHILSKLYDSARKRLRATGPIPLGGGRLHFTATYGIPILATCAQVEIDTGHPAFTGANLAATPLEVTVRGRTESIRLATGEEVPAVLARKIAVAVEGVRAWVSTAGKVNLQTVAAGRAAQLEVRKRLGAGDFHAQNTGDAPGLAVAAPGCAFTGGIDDTCALLPTHLCAVIHDAVARATLPYAVGPVAPQARMDGNDLVLEVAGGHTISVTAVKFSGGADPFGFSQNGPNQVRTGTLGSNLDLNGPGWVDLEIDGHGVRVPFDGEPARLELTPMERLPADTETLLLSVNGAAATTLTFSGNVGRVSAVADAIAQHFGDVVVRIAYMLSFENTLYHQPVHTLQLNDAAGLALAGFLDDRARYTTTAVSAGVDHLAVPVNLTAPQRDAGLPVQAFTLAEQAAGGAVTWKLNAQAGFTLDYSVTPAEDPLKITGGGTATLSTDPIPAELDLKHLCLKYDFGVKDAAGNLVAQSRLQMAAMPAAVRAAAGFSPNLPADKTLPVTVVEPTSAGATTDRVFSVDLAGVASLDQVVQRLNAEIPAIRAWLARPAASNLLHLETRGRGSGWQLRLGNPLLLLALGFDETQIDLNQGRLEVSGGGDVRNAARTTQDEVRSALRRAVQCATLLVRPAAPRTPQSLQIERSGTSDLVLRSLEGPVTVETEPGSLKPALHVTEAGGTATIAPGATASLDCGIIVVKAGGRSVAAVRLFGDHATLTADGPLPLPGSADETRQLTQLKAHAFVVNIAGTSTPVGPLDNAVTSLRDAVAWYAARLPSEARIGIDSSGQVVLQSRGRGDSSLVIEIDFSNFSGETFSPGDSLLGIVVAPISGGRSWTFNAEGLGSVPRLAAVPVWSTSPASLESLLRTAAQEGASRQAVYDVEVDSTSAPAKLRIRSNMAAWTLRHPVPPATNPVPGGISFRLPGGGAGWGTILESTYSLTPPVHPGELTLQINQGGVIRDIVAVITGAAARLPQLTFPATLSNLNGKGFDLAVGNASGTTTFNVRFAGVATQQQAAAQVESQCQWRVRANVTAGAMVIETLEEGTIKSLSLSAPSGGTPNAVTNDLATGFRAGPASSPVTLPLTARGGGTVPAMDNVEAEHYKNALLAGFISETTGADTADRDRRTLDWRAYEIATGAAREFFTLTSRRSGCVSAVEAIVLDAPGLALKRTMERAPAVQGSVVLPLPGINNLEQSKFNLANDGILRIELNKNDAEDLPPRTVVEVRFGAGNYSARDVARRLHEELFNRGAGQAAAYTDGRVVVETAVPGLAGSVTIPAPGVTGSAADQALLQKLLGSATAVSGRGWPGSGFGSPGDPLRPGFRSKKIASAQADAVWIFRDGGASATVNVRSGQTLQDIQRAVDSALRAPTGGTGRIGICLPAPDDTLYIEGMTPAFELEVRVNGRTLRARDPDRHQPGGTPEREEEPAVGLRRTDEIRTFRYARDRVGDGNGSEMDDVGWIRTPAFANSLPAAFNDRKGSPAWNLVFPAGRFFMALRADAAKTRDYHASGDMLASANTAPNDADHHFVHQARYWISFPNAETMGIGKIVRTVNGNSVTEYLVDLLWPG